MKKSILLICLSIASLLSFSQEFELSGEFYEGKNLMDKDSSLVSELISKFNIDTTGYAFISFYGDFDKNLELQRNYQGISYSLNILDGKKNFISSELNPNKEKLNKYILINEHFFFSGKKYINITIY